MNYKNWYESLSLKNQLFASFILYVVFLFVFSFLMNLVLWQDDKPVQYFLFRAIFMSFLFIMIFNRSKVKAVFNREKSVKKLD